MEPEEIDKLFKYRLASLPATPPADAWTRLQQKMEPPKKTRSMWIYYAAASITLFIISGIWFFTYQNTLNSNTVATVNKPNTSTSTTIKTDGPVMAIPEEVKTKENPIAQANAIKPDTKQQPAIQKPVTGRKSGNTPAPIVAKAQKPKKPEKHRAINIKADPVNTPTLPFSEPKEKLAQVNPDMPAQTTGLMASVVEVKIKRDTPAEADKSELQENISRKTKLLKNIYKQARNLKNGEQVELASLGINTDKINSETKELKHKINKVIPL